MADWTFPSPDNHYLQNSPPAEVRNVESFGVRKWPEIDLKNPVLVLTKRVSSDVGRIIYVAETGAINRASSEKIKSLKSEQENKEKVPPVTREEIKREKYRQLHKKLDKEVTFENIDDILKRPRRMFLEASIYGLYKWKFDIDGNIVIEGAKAIQKWSPEYRKMIVAWTAELRMIMHALILDAEKRGEDPDSFK